jgi:hypothetical protein
MSQFPDTNRKEITMRKMSLRLVSRTALAVVVILFAAQIPVTGQGKSKRLEGTWLVQGTVLNCQTGQPLTPPINFSGLNTFIAGGAMFANPASNPARASTGHGFWEHEGGRRFSNTIVSFLFNADGSFAGTQKVTRTIELDSSDSDVFTSTNSVEITDPAGTVTTRCSAETGHRVV